MKDNDIIGQYFNLLNKVYEYFNFKEDWVIYPLEDYRGYFWYIDNFNEFYGKAVLYSEEEDIINSNYYLSEIYEQRFYDKHIYRGKDYTLIFIDTHTDGNRFFAIFENSKELTKIVEEVEE